MRRKMTRNANQPVRVLIAMDDDDAAASLQRLLQHSSWAVEMVSSLPRARSVLRSSAVAVVVCQRRLSPAATWHAVLEETRRLTPAPRLVVTDRVADEELWTEVLHLGGYDVLVQPFDRQEAFRVLASAWRSWHDESHQAAGPARKHGGSAAA